jgi:penicillin amidase
MRIVPFLLSAITTVALIVVLNMQLPAAGSKTPVLGDFLSPQHGCWQNAESSNEDFSAELKFANLKGKVEVYFDDRLVPHVYAENDEDASFVQGYLHAKFRLWQMDFQTYAAGGRLSEVMGATTGGTDFLQIDNFFRRLGMVYAAEQSLKAIEADEQTKKICDSYTAGVNAYINSLQPHQYPLEYKLLDYQPEQWSNLKTALFQKYMAYDLTGGGYDFEMTNAKSVFSAADLELIYPTIQDSVDPIVPRGTIFPPAGLVIRKPASADSLYYKADEGLNSPMMRPDKDNGSNNWAVAGRKTKSGRPILCNDPHLGLNLPAIWYEMQITTPTYSCYGVSLPGSPSIVIGFNDSCAWGVTNAQRDVKDFYEITFKDTSMKEYLVNGKWEQSTFRNEVIKVKGQSDVVEKIAITSFGPVMYDAAYPNKSMDKKYFALKWTAHDATNEGKTFLKLDRSKNYPDYNDAISTYQTPGQNILFATKTGDIAFTHQGQFPAKWRRQGDFVMPSDTAYMWQGYIPTNENPSMYNPERGFLSSANQMPADASYPYYLSGSFPPYRGIIINRRLNDMNSITPADMQQLQTSNYNVFAELARPLLLKYLDQSKFSTDEMHYINQLKNWNFNNDISEEGATIFRVWWDSLEVAVWRDEFMQTKLPMKWPDESTLLEALLRDSSFKFVDDIRTPGVETLSQVLITAFKMAYPTLKDAKAKGNLAWGKFKDSGVRHLLRIPALSRLHLPIGGGEHIINATKQFHGPSWRMVVHLTDDVEAYGVYPGGQSGNSGSKYYDAFVDTWAVGKYYRLQFLRKEQAIKQSKWKMTFSKA